MLLLLLLATAAAALTPENVAEIQQQQALVAESSLKATMSQCLLHNYCKVGAAPPARIPADSIAFGLSESYKIVAKVLENNRGRILPNMQKIKTAFNLGQKTQNAALCQEVFRCAKTEVNLPTETEVAARKAVPDCGEVAMVCPGVSTRESASSTSPNTIDKILNANMQTRFENLIDPTLSPHLLRQTYGDILNCENAICSRTSQINQEMMRN